jgi:hypothetical protein
MGWVRNRTWASSSATPSEIEAVEALSELFLRLRLGAAEVEFE